jgi:hypothetical protein
MEDIGSKLPAIMEQVLIVLRKPPEWKVLGNMELKEEQKEDNPRTRMLC